MVVANHFQDLCLTVAFLKELVNKGGLVKGKFKLVIASPFPPDMTHNYPYLDKSDKKFIAMQKKVKTAISYLMDKRVKIEFKEHKLAIPILEDMGVYGRYRDLNLEK